MIPMIEYVILTKDVMNRTLDSGILDGNRLAEDRKIIKALMIVLTSSQVLLKGEKHADS